MRGESGMNTEKKNTAYYHLPGLFEFYELYRLFLPLFREHREYFYDWCDIGSVYGAPADCLWGGGRVGFGDNRPEEVLALMREYGISARLTFSNSLLQKEHLSDKKCNELCAMFGESREPENGVIVHSDLLAVYLQKHYPGPPVRGEPEPSKRRDRPFGAAAGLFEKDVSPALLRLLHHEGADGFCRAYGRTKQKRISLCGAGFPPEQGF